MSVYFADTGGTVFNEAYETLEELAMPLVCDGICMPGKKCDTLLATAASPAESLGIEYTIC